MKEEYKHVANNNGGKTSYYDIPAEPTTLNDLIEYKKMPFWQGEMFKALYALEARATRASDGTSSEVRELNKIIYYAHRRLKILARETEEVVTLKDPNGNEEYYQPSDVIPSTELKQVEEEKGMSKTMKFSLIVGGSVLFIGVVAFLIYNSRKK